MSYTHRSIVERSKLEILHQQGKSSRFIAKELGRHPSLICRELERAGSSQPYHAQQAQNAYQERRKVSISNGKWSSELAATLEEKLQATWSPEQISERFRTDGLPRVSFKTIYRWLYEDDWFEVNYRFFGTKANVENLQKHVVNSPLDAPFQIGQKKFVLAKRLGTSNWIPS